MSFVWGVDPAVSHQAFAFADAETSFVHVETLMTGTDQLEGARLGSVYKDVKLYAHQAALRFPPAVVWVEQASGRFPKPQLSYVVGVIQAALFEATKVPVWSIPSGAWKKRTVGVGNASKSQVAAWVERCGFAADGQDEMDAVAIAVAGRAMFLAGSWEAAA